MELKHTAELEELGFHFILHDEASDTYAALIELAFTVAIAYDINPDGFFEERYCYERPEIALSELMLWHQRGFNSKRPVGWIACRKVNTSELKESFEKHYGKDYASNALSIYQDLTSKSKGSFVPYEWAYPKISSDENEAKHLMAYLRATGQI